MNYKTKIYISGVTNLSDARYAAGMMVDFIGFCIDDHHETSISEENFGAINNWIEGIRVVGEFYEKTVDEINDLIDKYSLDYIQLPITRLQDASRLDTTVILLANQVDEELPLDDKYIIRTDSLDFYKDHDRLLEVNRGAIKVLDLSDVYGVCIRGGDEERPGYKDYDEIGDILEQVEID